MYSASPSVRFAPTCPCGNDYCRCMKYLAAYGGDAFLRSLQLYFFYLPLLENLYRIVLYMCAECVGSSVPVVCGGDKVFYAYRFPSPVRLCARQQSPPMTLAYRVDGCGSSGWSAAQYQHVEISLYRHFILLRALPKLLPASAKVLPKEPRPT